MVVQLKNGPGPGQNQTGPSLEANGVVVGIIKQEGEKLWAKLTLAFIWPSECVGGGADVL